jgi:hypothetical protein
VKRGMSSRRWLIVCLAAGLVAAAALAAGLADAGTGPVRQGVEGPETIAEAQRAIEALPWAFTFTHPPRDSRNALIIRTTDAHERSFRFFLFRGRAPRDIGLPKVHLDHLEGGQLGVSFVIFDNGAAQVRPETDTTEPHPYQGDSEITAAMEEEFFEISFAVEDAVCELSTGKPCPAV